MGLLSAIFGKDNKEDIQKLLSEGAIIVDVRSPQEFMGGHVTGAKNIPLGEIQRRKEEVMKLKKPVVFCCRSGARSGQATDFFKAQGLNCENGGPWTKVNALV